MIGQEHKDAKAAPSAPRALYIADRARGARTEQQVYRSWGVPLWEAPHAQLKT